MTHLNIQQGLNIEVVSTSIIKKLYDAALSVSEPLEGELDAAYMSGNLQVDKTYRTQVSYLTTRFPDLHINVTGSYYIPFEDSNVQSVLMANNISSDGVGITEADAATATLGTIFKNNTDITSFDEFKYFTKANTNPSNNMFEGCNNLISINLSNITKLSNREFLGTGITTVNMPNLLTISDHEQFLSCSSLTTVLSLGDISSLGNSMFRYCGNLESVVLPNGITTVPVSTFAYNYGLTTINLQNVSVIWGEGFRECDLTNVNANTLSNLVSVGEYGFLLTKIYGVLNLPRLSSLGSLAFDRCYRLTGIECLGTLSNIPGNRMFYGTGITYAKIPYECTNIGSSAFENCSSLTSITQYNKSLNDYEEGETPTFTNILRVTNIGLSAFRNCSNLAITINLPSLTNLGLYAFLNTGITSITDLGSISTIPESCFNNCNSLTTVTLPNTCNSISNLAFALSSALTTINLGNITLIGDYAFGVCTNLTGNYVLPNLNSIGTGAFNQSGVISVDFTGSTIVSISNECFRACTALTSITLPSTCTNIGSSAFRDATSLTTINLDNIVSIGSSYTFGSTKIVNFMLPNIQTIANSAFRYCQYSQLIDMGPNLSSIGDQAFYESTFTVFIFRGATVPAYDANTHPTFLSNMSGVTIYVPESALNDYKTAWPAMASNIVKIEGSAYDT